MKRRMRRKILAILTTVAMVLSLAPSALAGPFSDVPDNHQYAAAINRLAELGVLEGVGGGKYDPEGTYTRAQFAALVTKLMGLKAAAEASKGATDFSDVPADHWASGYVNVASSMGIIKGYGDGTFKPDKLVNHAEALTMLVRALGYEPVLKGKWPANVLVKAAELGLTNGVTVVAKLPASRAEVAQFSNNAVDVPMLIQTGFGDNVSYCVSGSKGCGDEKKKTLLMGSLGQTVEGVVIGSAERVDSNVKTNELVIDVNNTPTTYKVAAGVNVLGLLGHKVTALTKSMGADTVIVGLSERDDANFTTKVVKTVSATSLELCDWDVTGATYKDCDTRNYASSAAVFANGKKVAAASVASTLGSSSAGDVRASVKLNSDDEIAAVSLYNYKEAKLVSTVNASKQRIDYKIGATDNLDGYTVVVVRDGKLAGIGDIQAGDVVHVLTSTSPKRAVIYASSKTASGAFGGADSKTNPKVVYIGGTTYSLGSYQVSTDNGDNYNKSVSDIDANANVTAYFDGAGRIIAIKTGQAAAETAKNYALVTSIWREGAPGSHVFKVKMTLGTGSSVTYDLNDDTKVNGATYKVSDGTKTTKNVTDAVYEGTAAACENDTWTTCDFATKVGVFVMVTYELSGSSTLTKLDTVHGALDNTKPRVDSGDNQTLNFDADTNRIDGIRVDSGAVVFDVKDAMSGTPDASKIKVRTWDAVKKATGTRQGEYVVDGRIKAILLSNYTDLGAGGLARAIVTGAQWVGGDSYKLTVLQEDGSTKEYTAKDADWDITRSGCTNGDWTGANCTPQKKDVVTVEQVGSTVTVKALTSSASGVVTDHNTGYERITVGSNNYYYDPATVVVFDASGDTITKSSMSAVSNGTNVTIYLKSGNLIDILVIN